MHRKTNITNRTRKLLLINVLAMIVTFLFGACQVEVFPELPDVDPTPVVEAVWTNDAQQNFVRLSLSQDYYNAGDNPRIEDANVNIIDEDLGEAISFRFDSERGLYLPVDPEKVGEIGKSYRLEVEWEGQIIEGMGVLLEPPVFDSLTYRFRPQLGPRPEGYFITVFGNIPFEENNYYRLRITRNDTLLNQRGDYLLFDDTFGTDIFDRGFEINRRFRADDHVKVELFRLNVSMFTYYNELVSLLFNDGGLFSPPPENPPTNLRIVGQPDSRVLGYFKVAPRLEEEVTILPLE